jgi:geranylgeranyl diphosphate synthase type II
MDIARHLEEQKQSVDKALNDWLSLAKDWPPLLQEAISYSLFAGGKRIRPILALASLESVGGEIDRATPLVCALELIHTYSLIHDDLPAMDNDDLRRGRPTSHKKFGEGVAILAGDALLTAAFSLVADPRWEKSYPAQVRLLVLHELSLGAGGGGMVGGQLVDITSEGKEIDAERLRYIHSHKTGALIRSSIRFGALLGGAEKPAFQSLSDFGERIGLAFQIADDILDVEGTREELGKHTQRDRENQKNTYPSLVGLDRSKSFAKTLVEEALASIERFDRRAEPLREIAKFIIERKN